MSDNNEKVLSEKEQARLEAQFDKEKQPERVTLESFSAKVAEKAGVEQDKAKTYIHGMFDYIGDGLKNEDSISIFRFGTFKKKWKEERDGFNPQTQEPLKIPAHYKVTFSPSEPLANEVNRKYRQLRPNVIDELLTLTGVTKVSPAYLEMIEKNEEMHARHVRARKRAIVVLIILLILLLLFFATLIFVPAYCYHEYQQNNKVVQFVTRVNRMFGLNSLSDRLRHDEESGEVVVQEVIIDEEKVTEFMEEAKESLEEGRKIQEVHIVREGDTIFGIAKEAWGNQYLWPDLYVLNQNKISDPDLIHPGDIIDVYEKIGDPENMNKQQRNAIVQAYIGVYRVYRSFGERDIQNGTKDDNAELIAKGYKRIEDSCWTLYTAIRYDKNLLKTYKDAIYAEDIAKISLWIDNLQKRDVHIPFFEQTE